MIARENLANLLLNKERDMCPAHIGSPMRYPRCTSSASVQWKVITDVRFNTDGQISSFAHTGPAPVDAFERWAFSTFPGLCDVPIQCPVTLLDIIDEYLQTTTP